MRPFTDKEIEVTDLDRLFEEYVETDLFQPYSDSTADQCSLAHLFDLPSSNESDAFATSPMLDRDMDIAWHKAVQQPEQNQASSMSLNSSFLFTKGRPKEPHSDSELLSFEDIFESERYQLRSVSQPSTPRPHTIRPVKKAVSFYDRLLPRGVQKTLRKSPTSTISISKMMQPSFHRAPVPDVWTRKIETPATSFALRSSNGIASPPSSTSLEQHDHSNGFFHHTSYMDDASPLASPAINTDMSFSSYHLTPQASPAIGLDNTDHFSANMGLAFSSSASSAALSASQTPPSSLRLPMTTWGPDTSPSLDFGFSAEPDFSTGTKTAGWWDEEQSHSNSHSRTASKNVVSLEGLGISCDTSSFGDFADLGIHGADGNDVSASSFDMGGNYTTSSNSNMYPTPPNRHNVPIGHRPISRTPSPTPHPRFHRRRPSSQNLSNHAQHQHSLQPSRRKSSTTTSSRQSSSGNVGFVNFTPHDSRKILTGVAPSGSSKTKARREKEAVEKRRKLSQAAVRAVVEAGGDLGRLEREGLLVLETS